MPSALPDGEPVPDDGALPASALAGAADRPLGFYLHVPYCATRCGYCDFNTYTATELRGIGRSARLPRQLRGHPDRRDPAGPQGPRRRPARRSARSSSAAVRRRCWPPGTSYGCWGRSATSSGSRPDAEITTEANPESVDPAYLAALREGGFNRISFGMQSAKQHVLKVLDRTHTPGRPEACVAEARAAGFDHVNLDLIYGTPGESDDDWRASLEAAIGAGPDHVSAYALIVEEGTQLARRIRRGEVPMTDDDVHADRYLIAEEVLSAAGFDWYEVSNWATSRGGPLPAQRAVLAGRRLVGRRARVRTATWAGCAGGT